MALLCALPLVQAAAPQNAAIGAITFSEQPVHVVRDTSMISAGRGVLLAANDLIETGPGMVQLELKGATVALAPASRLFIRGNADLVLLAGWMKIGAGAGGPAVATATIEFASAGASVIVHAAPSLTELFAESGDLAVMEVAAGTVAKSGRPVKLPHEQYAVRAGAAPIKVLARPPKEFSSAMPRGFFDPLIAVALKGPPVAPKIERRAQLSELMPLLSEHPTLRQQFVRRFEPPRPAAVKTPVRLPNDMY